LQWNLWKSLVFWRNHKNCCVCKAFDQLWIEIVWNKLFVNLRWKSYRMTVQENRYLSANGMIAEKYLTVRVGFWDTKTYIRRKNDSLVMCLAVKNDFLLRFNSKTIYWHIKKVWNKIRISFEFWRFQYFLSYFSSIEWILWKIDLYIDSNSSFSYSKFN
jgi:hypothetical protein